MIPERLAWSLIQNGWILRNKIIWYKPNAMPSSVIDRFSNRWEYLFMFSRSQRYYFDLDAVREPYTEPLNRWGGDKKKKYCKNCKWFRATDVAANFFPALAEAPRGCDVIIDCVKPKMSGFANSKELNKNNDCDWYNRKHWWHRFCFENWG